MTDEINRYFPIIHTDIAAWYKLAEHEHINSYERALMVRMLLADPDYGKALSDLLDITIRAKKDKDGHVIELVIDNGGPGLTQTREKAEQHNRELTAGVYVSPERSGIQSPDHAE